MKINPFTLWHHLKTTNKIAKSETSIFVFFFFFFALACERIFIKTYCIESRCVIGLENILFEYTVCSLEILQAGEVKRLKVQGF